MIESGNKVTFKSSNTVILNALTRSNENQVQLQTSIQAQNPCDFCIDNEDICPVAKEATHLIVDKCLGIPVKLNVCTEHYLDWMEMKSGGLFN